MEFIIDYVKIAPDVLENLVISRTNGIIDYTRITDIDEDCFSILVDSFEDNCPDDIFDKVAEIIKPYLFE